MTRLRKALCLAVALGTSLSTVAVAAETTRQRFCPPDQQLPCDHKTKTASPTEKSGESRVNQPIC